MTRSDNLDNNNHKYNISQTLHCRITRMETNQKKAEEEEEEEEEEKGKRSITLISRSLILIDLNFKPILRQWRKRLANKRRHQ